MSSATDLIDHVQQQLEAIHDCATPLRARDFLLGRDGLARAGLHPRAPEELLIVERADGLDVGLYLSPRLFEALRGVHPDGRSGVSLALGRLPAFAPLAEGVSHFLYLTAAVEARRPVSRLALEVQGEVDKFAAASLHLWGRGLSRRIFDLCDRLFRRVSYQPHLAPDERLRYEMANRLAGGYARHLARRFVAEGRLDAFLRELRGSYRLWAGDKLRHLAAHAG